MKKVIAIILLAVCVFFAVRGCGGSTDVKPTKNLIVMITDGTSTGLLSLARWYKQYVDPKENLGDNILPIDPYICGLVRTHNSDAPMAESAGSMSAYMTGVLTQGKSISVYPHANPPQDLVPVDMSREYQPQTTLLEAAKMQGKSAGVVVTCYYHHATPAATSSHSVERGDEYTISRQMASQGLDVVFGGGSKYIDDDVKQIFDEQGITYYDKDIEGFRNHKDGKVWALFNDSHMDYELDRKDNEPSLTEMTKKALDLLSKNKKGFFLMVEGSKVDYGAHANDPAGTVSEFLEFNNAVEAVLEFAKKDGNTTVVIMPDHGTGGVQMGEFGYRSYSKKGLDSMFINFRNYKASGNGLEKMLNACSAEEIPSIFKEYTGIDLNERELMALKAHRFMTAADHMSIELSPNLSAEINKILTKHTHIGWTTYGHTGEDVFLAVYNPNDQRPEGFIRNVDINRYMRKVLGLKEDLETISDRIFVPHYEVFKHYDYAVLEGTDGPVLQVVEGGVTLEVPSNRSYVIVDGVRKDLGTVVPYIPENKTFYLPASVRSYLPKVAEPEHTDVPVYAWCSVKADDTPETFKAYLQGLKDKGVTGVCVNSSLKDREKIAMASKAAHEVGLVYHAWLPCMLQADMPHSWYAVNALGQSADTNPVYVDYYKALDPHNPQVIDWIVKQYKEIAQIPDVDYVQLDYIRYPDVVLSRGLWAKYNLDMTNYYAPADYCYCKDCIADFEAKVGRKLKSNPSRDAEWAQFREDVITNLVNKICEAVHNEDKKVSADVFPGPSSYAEWMVRQEWDKWEVDEFFPMNYNDFYLTDTKWIARVTGEEVRSVDRKPIYSGLFICRDWQNKANLVDPENSGLVPSEIESAVIGSMDNGAAGICLFTPDSMTPEHWEALAKAKEKWMK